MSEKFLYQTLKEMPLKLSEDEFLEYAKERRIPDYITSNIKHTLFEWQEYAIRSLIEYEYFKERNNPNIPTHLMFNMATGSGKTLVMAASILYYYHQGYRHFIFFVDQTNIVGKTQSNFIDKTHPKYLFKDRIFIDETEVNIKEVEVFNPETEDIEIKFVTTSKLHNDIHTERENNITLDQLNKLDIVLLADEAHHLNADTKRDDMEQLEILQQELDGRAGKNEIERRGWEYTAVHLILNKNNNFPINKNVMLEFTATIDMNQKVLGKYKDKIIYKFDLKEFLQKGYTKEINLISSNLDKKSRIIQALLFNWYREEIAFKYYQEGYKDLVNFKPVILFRSKDIEESKTDFNQFLDIIENLKEEDFNFLNKISQHMDDSSDLNEQGFSKTIDLIKYIDTNKITYNEIIHDLKIRFAKENCIITNSETNTKKSEETTEEQEELLNNLENHNNNIRAIFTVKRLTEGWDVLNLFDIVRLYQGQNSGGSTRKTPAATTQEKQLIGRGVRYYPFKYNDEKPNKRKFDTDMSNELRILEELNYYTYDEESRYISHLKEELRKDGYITDGKVVQTFSIKDSFKDKDYYNEKKLWLNYRKPNSNKRKNSLENIDENFFPTYRLESLELSEMKFEVDKEKEKDRLDISNEERFTREYNINCFEKNLVDKAMVIASIKKNSIYRFENLKEVLNVSSVQDILKDEFLGQFNIKIAFGSKAEELENINREEQLNIVKEFLLAFEKELLKDINPYEGTEFEPVSFEEVFGESKPKIVEEARYNEHIRLKEELVKEDWYVLDNFFGTDQERELIEELRNTMKNLEDKYEEVFLLRNEEVYKIYDFEKGRGFQPDFLLLLKDKNESSKFYQVFIEPKGDHLLKEDEWKEEFLIEISEKYGNGEMLEFDNENYSLIGLPLYNKSDRRGFDKEYNKIWKS